MDDFYREVTCLRCGHIWHARKTKPKCCSRCHNRLWDVPRRYKSHKENKQDIQNTESIINRPEEI